ncbi:MAG: hypothetical protein ACP5NV_03680 [Candidatus Woesearchaeota archaeon]
MNKLSERQKKDMIVAVRMPKGLVDELKDLQKINHFMDISDEIRYVIRKYSLNPANTNADKTVQELKKKEQLIHDLNRIILELKNGQ